jgi:hypothetical protein
VSTGSAHKLSLPDGSPPLPSGAPQGEGLSGSPSPDFLMSTSEVTDVLLRLAQSEALQQLLVKHFFHEVILSEVQRRNMVEPLMGVEELAQTLGMTVQGLYKKIQANDLGIPFIDRGRWGGYRFDPADVREAIRKSKLRPLVRPASLKRARRAR